MLTGHLFHNHRYCLTGCHGNKHDKNVLSSQQLGPAFISVNDWVIVHKWIIFTISTPTDYGPRLFLSSLSLTKQRYQLHGKGSCNTMGAHHVLNTKTDKIYTCIKNCIHSTSISKSVSWGHKINILRSHWSWMIYTPFFERENFKFNLSFMHLVDF